MSQLQIRISKPKPRESAPVDKRSPSGKEHKN